MKYTFVKETALGGLKLMTNWGAYLCSVHCAGCIIRKDTCVMSHYIEENNIILLIT